ncbi:MAG TPA: zinc-dependent metalloprotease [Actinomycetaceae bacterium]|nr:zinc-dependent metalloprotease [Actinomycetaceae bacterium]
MASENPRWEEVLRNLLGPEGARRAIESMREAGLDPDALGSAAGIPTDPAQLQNMLAQIRHMMASSGDGPVNWDLARDVARQQVHAAGDPSPTASQDARAKQYLQAAELWLDSVTDLVGPAMRRGALSRARWIEEALPTFRPLGEPVAENVVRAVSDLLTSQMKEMGDQIGELAGLGLSGPQATDILRRIGGATFGMQLGQAVASLAQEAFGLTDLGVPLTDTPGVALIPANVDAFADGFDISVDEIAQFLAVREVAHARLYSASPWLRGHVLGLVQNYAREISIDVAAMEESFRSIDPTNPEELREALGSGIFAPDVTDAQKRTLESLETTLAVIEGWVEHVTSEATRGMLPNAVALTEMMRRRRATGGPAEDVFRTLVGLELRPRRCREAATLWQTLTSELGTTERDKYWSHPDLMPSSDELDDPSSLVASRAAASELDDAIEALLSQAEDEVAAERARAAEDGEVGASDADADDEGDDEHPAGGLDS